MQKLSKGPRSSLRSSSSSSSSRNSGAPGTSRATPGASLTPSLLPWCSARQGGARRQLQQQMMEQEAAGGHVSLDHVHQTAKRMAGGDIGMLIAMGGSGLVLGHWNVYSTSLEDVSRQLKELDARQRKLHNEVRKWPCVGSVGSLQLLRLWVALKAATPPAVVAAL